MNLKKIQNLEVYNKSCKENLKYGSTDKIQNLEVYNKSRKENLKCGSTD